MTKEEIDDNIRKLDWRCDPKPSPYQKVAWDALKNEGLKSEESYHMVLDALVAFRAFLSDDGYCPYNYGAEFKSDVPTIWDGKVYFSISERGTRFKDGGTSLHRAVVNNMPETGDVWTIYIDRRIKTDDYGAYWIGYPGERNSIKIPKSSVQIIRK